MANWKQPPFALMLAISISSVLGHGVAHAQTSSDQTPCVTQSQCDLRDDMRDTEARRAEWNANVKRDQDARAEIRRLGAEAQARNESGRLSRVQEVMRRRREAAAHAGN